MTIEDLINSFNEGETDFIEKYFNDIITFFKVLDKRGLLDEINIEGYEYQNSVLLFFYETNRKKFREYVNNLLSDIEIVGDDVYLIDKSPGELASLFCTNSRGDYLSRETIQELLDGEFFDWNWNYPDLIYDFYDQIIEDLNETNTQSLKNRILTDLNGKQIETRTSLLESIASEQGHDDYAIIDGSNIDEIYNDEETLMELLSDELEELKNELSSLYGSSYEGAYSDEVYEGIWSELDEYFDGKGEYFSRPHPYKENTTVEHFKIKIRNFYGIILDFLNENKNYSDYTLDRFGSYLGLLADNVQCLTYYYPEYADSSDVKKIMNETFNDYI